MNGDVAGRDINNFNYPKQEVVQELPHVFTSGGFGGNGHILRFEACQTHNLSNDFIILDVITILGSTLKFSNHTIIRAGESMPHSGNSGLSYPTESDQFLEIQFHNKNGIKYVLRQKLLLPPFADQAKLNANGFSGPKISLGI